MCDGIPSLAVASSDSESTSGVQTGALFTLSAISASSSEAPKARLTFSRQRAGLQLATSSCPTTLTTLVKLMEEENSHNRFSALVSGTAADQMKPGYFSLKRQQAGSRAMSPAPFSRQEQLESNLLPAQEITNFGSPISSGDLVRRPRLGEAQRDRLVMPSKLSTQINYTGSITKDNSTSGHRHSATHLSGGGPISTSKSLQGTGISPALRSNFVPRAPLGPLRSSKSLRQRLESGGKDERGDEEDCAQSSGNIQFVIRDQNPPEKFQILQMPLMNGRFTA